MSEKRNCDYYEVFDNFQLEKAVISCQEKIETLKTDTVNLQHNLKNILFVLKSRKISRDEN